MFLTHSRVFSVNNLRKLIISRRKISIQNIFRDPRIGKELEISGWITNIRKQKEYIFIDLNDGSTSQQLQILISTNSSTNVKELSVGSSIKTLGSLLLSPKGTVELIAKDVEILTKCSTELGYPFAPRKQYSAEYVRQYIHLRHKTRKFASLLRVRSAAALAFHSTFHEEGFLNIHTPILTTNDCEGAGEAFKVVPESKDLLKSMTNQMKTQDDVVFFNNKSFLTVSGQLHLEAIANGLGNVYTFGPTFRAENSKSRLHLSEFYMIEAEIAFINKLEPLIKFVERIIKKTTRTLLENHISDVQICQETNKDELLWVEKEFNILTYNDAMKIIQDNSDKFQESVKVEKGIKKEHEIFLVKHLDNVPTFIINWPKSSKPFYMKENENDSSEVLAFDLLAPGIGEIVGGSLREDDLIKLENKLPQGANLSWYLDSRRYGGVPTGGFGIGFERYLQTILKIDNIKDTIPFPRWPHNCFM